ncbi:serine hydrolase domain-containing protein [Paenibacillus aurantiacus]|uniref:Serine hydrolase domain-containing protein n=1 Tax=Paenibacillus aurantiacus TaxID=1936118 RepID=A0ABV5KLX4_9BACL
MTHHTEAFTQFLHDYERRHGFAGTVSVSRHDEIIFSQSCGMANDERGILHSPSSMFRIGSITKSFTAASVLRLADQGQLSLDDAIGDYFPSQRSGERITLGHLLSHTSGIVNYTDDPLMREWASMTSTPEEIFDRFAIVELLSPPGSAFHYSNSNYVLLGMLIERISGQPYAQFLRSAVLAPLGMQDTQVETPGFMAENRLCGYELDASGAVIPAPLFDPTQAYAAGNLLSTAHDLRLWDRALRSDQFLAPDLASRMYKPALAQSPYGFGWFVQDTPFGRAVLHGGGITGYASMFLRFLDTGITVIVLSNVSRDVSELSKQLAILAHQVA